MKTKIILLIALTVSMSVFAIGTVKSTELNKPKSTPEFTDAALFGFSPKASGMENVAAMQNALDLGGTIIVSQPGIYKIAATLYVGSNTEIVFGKGVFLKKVDEQGRFAQIFLNKGAFTKSYDKNITIDGLHAITNGVDNCSDVIIGLRGHLGFYYVKDLKIKGFRCYDLTVCQYAVHISRFEDVIIEDVIIKGQKDGIHFGPGKRFTIRDGVFQTFDDAIALNGQDYSTTDPEIGWIEDGIIENCYDLDQEKTQGFFCRFLGGGWPDWEKGMKVHQSDAVVSNGRVYRVIMPAAEKFYTSTTKPDFESGKKVLDGITWYMAQETVTYTAGVRNVILRNIQLEKARVPFSIEYNLGKYNRSYITGAEVPVQENIILDNVKVMYEEDIPLIQVFSAVNMITITNSRLKNTVLRIYGNEVIPKYMDWNIIPDFYKTSVNIHGCIFDHDGEMMLLHNSAKDKEINLKTSSNIEIGENFSAKIIEGGGKISVQSDLTGLKK